MIHNGIEYGLIRTYAEGFDILKNAARETPQQQHSLLRLIPLSASGVQP